MDRSEVFVMQIWDFICVNLFVIQAMSKQISNFWWIITDVLGREMYKL
jgi:hypothetical protein